MPFPALALLLALALAGCGADERAAGAQAPAPAPTMGTPTGSTGAAGSHREGTLGAFLSGHWQLPVPPQGDPPAGFSEIEASLDPAMCGACHPEQYAQWQTSFHARAWSPGLAGQLIEGGLAAPAEVRMCQSCHTPLAEQMPFDATGAPAAGFDPALRASGVSCAGCHVRSHQRFGPPRRTQAAQGPEPRPHAGFTPRREFQESRFCATCHQFFDDAGVNGKPMENTFEEWRASPQGASGRQCQDCHMPDRAHLWRGIHDAEMVRGSVDVALLAVGPSEGRATAAALVVHNRDVGHGFPTYVTPRVLLAIYQVDRGGRELPDTRVEGQIARVVDFAEGVEVSDTRVLPRESVRLDYGLPRAPGAVAVEATVTVDPDFHYRGVYAYLLETLSDSEALALIAAARDGVADSAYRLATERLELPPAPGE